MAIPNSIVDFKSGIPGTLSHAGPVRALSAILDSQDADNNAFGRAFTHKDTGTSTVQAGGDGAFAGIMVNPHAHAIDSPLVSNGQSSEFLHMGEVFVKIVPAVDTGKNPVAPAVGNKVYFVEDTGEITCDPTDQAAAPTSHIEIVGAAVVRHAPADMADGSQLAVISLTGFQPSN